jgi:hypothetical protein
MLVPEMVPEAATKDVNAGEPAITEYSSGVPVVELNGIENEVALDNTVPIGPTDAVGKELTITTAVVEFVQALFTSLATVYVIVALPEATP